MIIVLLAIAQLAARPANVVHADEKAAYEAMLTGQAVDADAAFSGQRCEAATIEDIVTEPVAIGDRPDVGALRERVRMTGCGRSSIQNIMVARLGGEPPWRMAAGFPGESLADATLQHSALPQVIAQARVEVPADCASVRLGDIYVSARQGSVEFGVGGTSAGTGVRVSLSPELAAARDQFDLTRAWSEVWPLSFCNKDRSMMIVFIPRKDETSSAMLFIPVWRQVETDGPGALPAHAPPA